jgi:xylulokinase
MDAKRQLLALASSPLEVSRPQALWSEQNPSDWWQALEVAMAQLQNQAPTLLAQVRSVGLSGQMHGAVALDKANDVLRPAILWNDGRAHNECAELQSLVPNLAQITGNVAMAGFTAPKLLWMRRFEPALFAQTHKVLLPKDWLRLGLTGETVTDMSDASGTLWLDVAARRWSEPVLQACGLTKAHMPQLIEGNQVSGVLKDSLSQRWGLPKGVLVAGGAGDNAATAVGLNVVQQGQGFISLGTSGVVFVANDVYRAAPENAVHTFAHALPNRWHQMAVMLSAASAITWGARLLGLPNEQTLLDLAQNLSVAQKSQAPMFLPYLSGERTPHNNPHACGSITHLRQQHTQSDIAYAIVEGISFGLMDGYNAITLKQNLCAKELLVVGGGARSDFWVQLLASGLGRRLRRKADAPHAAAIGAAMLAAMADNVRITPAAPEFASTPSGDETVFEPFPGEEKILAPRYEQFRRLYPMLNQAFA